MELRGKLQGLEWLLEEVEVTLHQAYEALESYIGDPSDETQLRYCLSYIHQIHGSLKIAECHGPLLLAEEMEALAECLLDGSASHISDACDVMVQAMLKLPAYLRQVMSSRRDQPETLLLLLNELRAVRKEPLVSETSFFAPQMEAAKQLSKPYNRQPDPVSMSNLLRKLRQMYQYALLGVVKGEKIEENFGYLDKVFSRLKELSKGLPREPLWTAVLALLEGIAAKEIPLGYAVKMILRELDTEIHELVDSGVEGMNAPLPERLLKKILFYIAYAHSEMPRASQVREAYGLDASLPAAMLEESEDGLSPVFHPETAKAIVAALDEEFSGIKDSLDRYTMEGGDNDARLEEVVVGLKRVSDSLAVLGRNELRETINSAHEQVLAFKNNPSDAAKGCLMLVATHLVESEAKLHGWLENNRQLIGNSAPTGEMQLEVNRAQNALLQEACLGLRTIREAIVEFIASQWQRDHLDGVPEVLSDVRGALEIVGLDRAANVLKGCTQYLVQEVLTADSVPNWNSLDALADAITSVEYFLENIGQDDEQAEETILGLAEQGVIKLGYDISKVDATAEAAAEPTIAEPSEPLPDPEPAPAAEEDIADQEIIEIYVEEVSEVLEYLETAYLQWVDTPSSQEPLAEIRRAFHTLKGSSRMVGAEALGDLAWAVENLLNRAIEKRVTVTPTLIAFVDLAREVVPGMTDAFEQRTRFDREKYVEQLVVAAEALVKGEETNLPEETVAEAAFDQEIESEEFAGDVSADEVEAATGLVSPEDTELLEIFATEAREHLAVLQCFVEAQRREAPVYAPVSSDVQGALHTLKGSAKMADVVSIGDLTEPLEHYLRDLYSYQRDVDKDIVDLLADAVDYCGASLDQIDTAGRAAEIAELPQFLARIESLKSQLVEEVSGDVKQDAGVDPSQLNALMIEGIHHLLDAKHFLADWQQQAEYEQLPTQFGSELDQLTLAADKAGFVEINQLSLLLSQVYSNILQQHLPIDDERLKPLLQSHELLLGMVDCVAASQDLPSVPSDLVEQLQGLASTVAEPAEPAAEEPEAAEVEAEQSLLPPLSDITIQPLSNDDIDLDILDTFIAEADELLEGIDQELQGWEQNWSNTDHVATLKRLLHTLKGGARMAGLEQLGQLSHDMENDILILEQNRSALNSDIFGRLLKQQDYLLAGVTAARQLFDTADNITPASYEEPADMATEVADSSIDRPVDSTINSPVEAEAATAIESSDETELVQSEPQAGQIKIEATFKPDVAGTSIPLIERQVQPQDMVKVPEPLLESLVNLAGETSISRGRVEQQVSEFAFTLDEMEATIVRLRDQVRRLGMETDAQVMFRKGQLEAMSSEGVEGFDPLEMDRYSQLQQLSRALLESASDLKDLKGTLAEKARAAEAQLLSQSRINTDLQERLMRTQMVPFSRMVPRLRRMVRQLSEELGKKVELRLANVDGEMDRSMMEQMLAPLEHMIRNSIDHGIEPSEQRVAQGKSEVGVIAVGLVREGSDILLTLADDGRGLNLDAIHKRAIELGMMQADDELDHQKMVQLVFRSGFSTSKKVSQVSGRGVGMDVVNNQVRELGGSVQITTKPGEGTQFTVRLPFTMSVNRALMIEMGEDLFALPLNSVDGVVRISSTELEQYYRYPDAKLAYAGDRYEVRYLGSLLSEELTPKVDMSKESALMVLVHSETNRYAVQVDGLVGSNEIIVKSLGPQFSKVPGLSGATLLGDGRVVVILDLLTLLRTQVLPKGGVELLNTQDRSNKSSVPTVMVVDDSVTVRKVAGRFLEREGFNVITARDGVEAMRLLQDQLPDIMLLDIEMPRMDGFEVARRIKGNQEMKHIPIIMITSRMGDKHRERAMALGVEEFLGKPYREEVLLDSISELLGMVVE